MSPIRTQPVQPLSEPVRPCTQAGEKALVVGRMLATASEALVGALTPPARTSTDLAKTVGVNKDIASRFLIAAGKRDPLAVIYYMPGVESLRRLSRGASSRTSNPKSVESFENAVNAYEAFLQTELGGRHALDSMASAWLPEARERFESASRQMAYRAMANLRGVECQTIISAALLHPGDDPQRFDAVQVEALIGAQRLRPAVRLMMTTFDHRDDTQGHPRQTIDGRPIRPDIDAQEFLPQFGRGDPPALEFVRAGTSSYYHLVDEGLGAQTASDLFFGHFTPGMFRRWARFPGDVAAMMEGVEMPAQRLIMDVLVHPDVWPGIEPELMLYGTYVRGVGLPYDRSRDVDRMDLLDSIRCLGQGIDCCRISEAPRYMELLRWTCECRGWDPSRFRVYRCDSRYPLFGVQYTMAFKLFNQPE